MGTMLALYLASDRPMASAPVLHQATSPTLLHATWAHRFFAELYGSDGVEVWVSRPFDGVDVSVSRPSNDRCHANRCAPNQNADALRPWSCRTLKLLMVWSPPTTQRSLRHPWGRSVLDQYRGCSGYIARPACAHVKAKSRNRRLQVMPAFKGQYVCPI